MIPFLDLGKAQAVLSIPSGFHLSDEDVEKITSEMNQY
jgi:hypothetical protein